MNRNTATALAAVVLVAVGGCMPMTREQLVREQVAAMNEVTVVLDTIQSDAVADAAMPKLEKAVARLAAANARSSKTQTRGGDPDKAMQQLNDPKVQEMIKQLMDAGFAMAGAEMKAQGKAPGHAARIREIVQKANVQGWRDSVRNDT